MTSSDDANAALFACHGRALRVDASTGQGVVLSIDERALRRFLGGSGLGVYLMLTLGAADIDPLSADAPLAFVFSPLVGGPLTTSAKFAVVGKGPLTGRINDSLASSQFAISGKRTGFDAIVVVGRATSPSVLIVDDGHVRLESADDIWGQDCPTTERLLRERLGADYSVAAIGPAGESLVRFATISHDGRHAGRGGSGATLGAKNVKAIAVRGQQRTDWARPSDLVDLARDLSRRSFGPATAKYRELGTAANLLAFNRLGALPTRNFQLGRFDGAQAISPEQLSLVRSQTRASCVACTIGCEHLYELRGADGAHTGRTRIEYENLFALGPLCGVDDPDVVLAASRRCDELGLDTISTGGTIAFAMECAERGLIDAPTLRFGSGEALLEAIEQIARRQGIGDLLAEGSRRAAAAIGQNSIDLAPQVKGLEIPGYEPRALQTMALGFAVTARGADHNRSGAYEADFSASFDRRAPDRRSVEMAIETEDRAAIMDSLILCKFVRGALDDFWGECSQMLNLTTGWDTTAEELQTTAKRIVAAKHLFNIRAGWSPKEDTLPARFLREPLPHDAAARLSADRLASLVAEYRTLRGWTQDGAISREQLEELSLDDV